MEQYILGITQTIAIIIPLAVIIRAMKEKPSKGLMLFTYCISGVLLVEFGYFFTFISQNANSALFSMKLAFVGKFMVMIALFDFIEEFYRRNIPKWLKHTQVMCNILMAACACFTEKNHLFFKEYSITRNSFGSVFSFSVGPIYCLYGLEVVIVIGYCASVEIIHMKKMFKQGNMAKYLLMLVGTLLPGIAYLLFILRIMKRYESISIALAIATLVFYIDIVKYHLFGMTSDAKEHVLDHSTEAIMVVDPFKNVLYMNQMVKKVQPQLRCFQPMSEEYEFLLEGPNTRFSKFNRYFEATKTVIMHGDGELQGYLLEVRDVTEATRKKEEMNRLMEEAEAANQAKSAFLTHMSYEIRTPINAVLGMDEMILRESQDSTIIEYAQNIRSAGKSLLSLINDILDFSKIESGEMEIVPQAYDFREILTNAKQMIEPRLEGKDVNYTWRVNPKLPRTLFGDQNRIQQILVNLLTNGAKYTAKGNVHLDVDFTKEEKDIKQGICLLVSVSDTGSGIKQEDLKKLFQSFQRVDEEKNRNIEGTGLGLAITSRLLEAMDGHIEVESEYGKGSIFRFEVHQGVIDANPIGEQEKKAYSNQVERERFHAPEASVLVVDDNAVNIKVMKGLLKRNQVKFYSVMSGEECLQIVKTQKFDLIFMDHLMPEMDGIETLHHMQKEEHLCKESPVIALTANAVQGIKQMYIENGFTDYLMKPVSVDEMEEMMIHYLPKELLQLTEG